MGVRFPLPVQHPYMPSWCNGLAQGSSKALVGVRIPVRVLFICKRKIMYEYKAKIIDVYDGDTVTAVIELGFNVTVTEKVRLARIDTPEVRGEEKADGFISRDRLKERILDKDVIIKTEKDKKGKYGRYIAEIILDDENLNDWLVTEGLAVYRDY